MGEPRWSRRPRRDLRFRVGVQMGVPSAGFGILSKPNVSGSTCPLACPFRRHRRNTPLPGSARLFRGCLRGLRSGRTRPRRTSSRGRLGRWRLDERCAAVLDMSYTSSATHATARDASAQPTLYRSTAPPLRPLRAKIRHNPWTENASKSLELNIASPRRRTPISPSAQIFAESVEKPYPHA